MSFGLVAKTQLLFAGAWGQAFGTAMLGFVLIDLVAGPLLARAGLRLAGEVPDGSLGDRDDPLAWAPGTPARRLLAVGIDGTALAALRRAVDVDCHVILCDTDPGRLALAAAHLGPA
eukprot:tig00020710_g13293.t1